jgi:hypothetical protein
MAITISRWTRRDNASIAALGDAAYQLCRATRTNAEIRSSRFYWVNSDTVVIQSEADSFEAFERRGSPEEGKAVFALIDLARPAGTERWMEPRAAEEAYRLAGR